MLAMLLVLVLVPVLVLILVLVLVLMLNAGPCSMMWLGLQRSKTARALILKMDELTRLYGYASTGESFSVADPTEVWHVDFVGTGPGTFGAVWVAKRLPKGYVG